MLKAISGEHTTDLVGDIHKKLDLILSKIDQIESRLSKIKRAETKPTSPW